MVIVPTPSTYVFLKLVPCQIQYSSRHLAFVLTLIFGMEENIQFEFCFISTDFLQVSQYVTFLGNV